MRNHVLILPATRNVNYICHRIALAVPGVTTFYTTGEYGRTGGDRKRLARFLTGIARNPNVANVLLIGMPHGYGYPEFQTDALAAEIAKSGTRLEILNVDRCGGLEGTVVQGIRLARELVREATAMRREAAPLSKLTIGMKCGDSDATSGLAGNPALGRAVDRLIDAGGTALFSETLELIGAEQTLVQRAKTPEVAQRLLRLIESWEARAASIGEDIRTINPIPENIAAGITTLEEKSLGAVEKTGTRELSGVLDYCERPGEPGLWLMDAWMSSYSLLPSFAAAGAQIVLYQLGGNELPPEDAPLSAVDPGLVAPLLTISGNPRTAKAAGDYLDVSTGGVLLGTETLDAAGEHILEEIVRAANGRATRGETMRYPEPFEVFFEGPFI
ncbi:MAG: UxaA family hydrolase [Oscillospiraceae bacterium]